jgi:hypothetical protein
MNNYVVCLKWGDKYSPEYVNKLKNMVERNLSLPYEFVCFTEDSSGIDKSIRCEPLPSLPVNGWWYKPLFFDPNFILKGNILFLDLDLVIFKNIDNLFKYCPNKFSIIRDFNRSTIRNFTRMNSSVFRLQTGQHSQVYSNFIKDPLHISRKFHGDQDWIFDQIKTDFVFWPDEWIQSYKWEMRGRPLMIKDPMTGKRNFKEIGEPRLLNDTQIAVFHGEPNPKECLDPWVKENWV